LSKIISRWHSLEQETQTLTTLSFSFGSLTEDGGATLAVVVRFSEPAFAYKQKVIQNESKTKM